MFAVAGVSGQVGSVAASVLLELGERVRAIVRNPAKGEAWRARGAEVAVASLDDPGGLAGALRGVTGAFLLVPPDYPKGEIYHRQRELSQAIAGAVREAQVPHVVFLSSVGAQHESGTGPVQGLHYAEGRLAETGADLTLLRAATFAENYRRMMPAVKNMGILPSFVDERLAIPIIASRDIGDFAGRALLDPPSGRRVWELAGPKDLTPAEVARVFSDVLGRPVQLVTVPCDGAVQAMTQGGMPEFLAKAFAEMYQAINDGRLDVTGTPLRGPTPLADVLRGIA